MIRSFPPLKNGQIMPSEIRLGQIKVRSVHACVKAKVTTSQIKSSQVKSSKVKSDFVCFLRKMNQVRSEQDKF